MASILQADSFSSISVLHLSSPSHLLASSCSPDKDLLLIISRLGNKDTISLWKMQGGRKWEVDVSAGDAAHEEVTGIAWSPDGMSILISHHPPRLSIHSIQDGRQERSVSFASTSELPSDFRVTGVWWLKYESPPKKGPEMPDFFKRNKTIPGSALSQLKLQPLLDPLKDDTVPITTSDLFSFQGILPTSTAKVPKLPDSIASWPALPPDLVAASIKPFPRPGDPQRRPAGSPEEVLDDVRVENSLNYDSLVVATDDRCRCHFFMDATYPLGSTTIGETTAISGIASLVIPPFHSEILANITYTVHTGGITHTNILPVFANIASLRTPQAREVAKASSAARELAWYMLRVVDEMRVTWVGTNEQGEGAQSLGPKWIKEIESRQRVHVASGVPNAIADLTALLVTGQPSDALNDVLNHLSERGIAKWETTMNDGLTKIRDFSEKRLALAAQRLYILLQEAKGWAMLSQTFGVHKFDETLVDYCLELLRKLIIHCAWTASTARDQLWRFKEFKIWLQYESNRANNDGAEDGRIRPLSWDVLEVNRYLMDGLNGCGLDNCFDVDGGDNQVPNKSPDDVRAPPVGRTVAQSISMAKKALDEPAPRPWENKPLKHASIGGINRNIEQLVKELARACQMVYSNAGVGVGQGVLVRGSWKPQIGTKKGKERADGGTGVGVRMRERTTFEDGVAIQYVLISIPRHEEEGDRLCLTRLQYNINVDRGRQASLQVARIACRVGDTVVDVLDFDFFDDETVVLILKGRGDGERGPAYAATVAYRDMEFTQVDSVLEDMSRERLGYDVMEHEECVNGLRLTGSRKLCLRWTEGIQMSVNGRVGRRTVCVLDGKGLEVEVLDMAEEGDGEDEEMGVIGTGLEEGDR
ncbi:anaphase-promoting complex, cyclosome, subunit 4-domain-containing protein [Hysterangium stoloniferum]|nr:anaphase-promoting complex, cyclosome, subunit 4-domain-containing protein [Hysterangium stoloniferum]